jgi:hypothetical protein
MDRLGFHFALPMSAFPRNAPSAHAAYRRFRLLLVIGEQCQVWTLQRSTIYQRSRYCLWCLLASTVRCLHSHGSASKYHARHENERALRLQRLVQIIEYIHGMLIC